MNRRGFLGALLSVPIAASLSEEILEELAPRRTIFLPPIVKSPAMEFWGVSTVGQPDFMIAQKEMIEIMRRAFIPKMVAQIYASSPLCERLIAGPGYWRDA